MPSYIIIFNFSFLFSIGARYRTDSETTDEQCIPESISEAHDSPVDDDDIVDDSDIAEDDHDTTDDKSPNHDHRGICNITSKLEANHS